MVTVFIYFKMYYLNKKIIFYSYLYLDSYRVYRLIIEFFSLKYITN